MELDRLISPIFIDSLSRNHNNKLIKFKQLSYGWHIHKFMVTRLFEQGQKRKPNPVRCNLHRDRLISASVANLVKMLWLLRNDWV